MDGRSRSRAPRHPDRLTSLWYTALESHLGIEVSVHGDTPKNFATKLYARRREAADPALASISIIFPANKPDSLWLVRREDRPAPESP